MSVTHVLVYCYMIAHDYVQDKFPERSTTVCSIVDCLQCDFSNWGTLNKGVTALTENKGLGHFLATDQ